MPAATAPARPPVIRSTLKRILPGRKRRPTTWSFLFTGERKGLRSQAIIRSNPPVPQSMPAPISCWDTTLTSFRESNSTRRHHFLQPRQLRLRQPRPHPGQHHCPDYTGRRSEEGGADPSEGKQPEGTLPAPADDREGTGSGDDHLNRHFPEDGDGHNTGTGNDSWCGTGAARSWRADREGDYDVSLVRGSRSAGRSQARR